MQSNGIHWPPTPPIADELCDATFERHPRSTQWAEPDRQVLGERMQCWNAAIDGRGRREVGVRTELLVPMVVGHPFPVHRVLGDLHPIVRR